MSSGGQSSRKIDWFEWWSMDFCIFCFLDCFWLCIVFNMEFSGAINISILKIHLESEAFAIFSQRSWWSIILAKLWHTNEVMYGSRPSLQARRTETMVDGFPRECRFGTAFWGVAPVKPNSFHSPASEPRFLDEDRFLTWWIILKTTKLIV